MREREPADHLLPNLPNMHEWLFPGKHPPSFFVSMRGLLLGGKLKKCKRQQNRWMIVPVFEAELTGLGRP